MYSCLTDWMLLCLSGTDVQKSWPGLKSLSLCNKLIKYSLSLSVSLCLCLSLSGHLWLTSGRGQQRMTQSCCPHQRLHITVLLHTVTNTPTPPLYNITIQPPSTLLQTHPHHLCTLQHKHPPHCHKHTHTASVQHYNTTILHTVTHTPTPPLYNTTIFPYCHKHTHTTAVQHNHLPILSQTHPHHLCTTADNITTQPWLPSSTLSQTHPEADSEPTAAMCRLVLFFFLSPWI